jgi:sugar phosphate isomerase/epimerase
VGSGLSPDWNCAVRFGISTYLHFDRRLERDHLAAIAARGFDAVELFGLRSHLDYRDPAAVRDLASWLAHTGLRLHSVHAPIAERADGGAWGPPLSTASADREQRARAVAEAVAVLELAKAIPFEHLVVHLGVPDELAAGPGDNSPEAARRSVEEIHAVAAGLGVRLALEVIPNRLTTAEALVRLLDDELELAEAGVCLDFGHAHMGGDLVDAIEALSGHIDTTHVHDNDGRRDDHLMPFDGSIDWPAALVSMQKVGYEGRYVFELAGGPDPAGVLRRAAAARARLTDVLAA